MTSDLEQEIKDTREHLGETVDALAAKLDVKARAQEAVADKVSSNDTSHEQPSTIAPGQGTS